MFSFASSRIVWWKCEKGHEWEDSINNRSRGNGCLVCSNRKVMVGVNDLMSQYPEIAKEWNYEKNGNLKPENVIYGSIKKVWWKCEKGHEWEERIHDIITRKAKNKCPYCSNKKVLYGFNDLETMCPEVAKEWNYDKNIYISPNNVIYNKDKKYWWKCIKCGYNWCASLRNRTVNNIGCPKCGIKKQIISYNRNQVLNKGSLLQKNPLLSKEWNYEKNGELTPDDIISTSNKKVWWKCEKGHEWEASIYKRNNGTGCPYCSNRKVLKGFNDLETKYPEVAKEWNYEKNDELKPSQVLYGSYKKVWWKCENKHEWPAIIGYRIMGYDNCPICKKNIKSNVQLKK